MNTAARKLPEMMTVGDFLDWPGDGTAARYELVDGVLRAQEAASDTHGTIQSNLVGIIQPHLRRERPGCRVVTAPGVRPRLRANWNFRIPELGVTCVPNRADQHAIPEPVVLIEILSPSNATETWSNIPLYASLPSVAEILIVDSSKVSAEILRRGQDGSWPQDPEAIGPQGVLRLASIGFETPLIELYRDTHLARPQMP